MDVLTLGGIAFTDYSTPDIMMGGGRQAMVVHKLPGGRRVIDTLGPDDASISWRGHFFSDNAAGLALTLDAMRKAGAVIPLTWGGGFHMVIIDEFIFRARRWPVWVDYFVTCVVVPQGLGGGGGGGAGGLIGSDLSQASGLG